MTTFLEVGKVLDQTYHGFLATLTELEQRAYQERLRDITQLTTEQFIRRAYTLNTFWEMSFVLRGQLLSIIHPESNPTAEAMVPQEKRRIFLEFYLLFQAKQAFDVAGPNPAIDKAFSSALTCLYYVDPALVQNHPEVLEGQPCIATALDHRAKILDLCRSSDRPLEI